MDKSWGGGVSRITSGSVCRSISPKVKELQIPNWNWVCGYIVGCRVSLKDQCRVQRIWGRMGNGWNIETILVSIRLESESCLFSTLV